MGPGCRVGRFQLKHVNLEDSGLSSCSPCPLCQAGAEEAETDRTVSYLSTELCFDWMKVI